MSTICECGDHAFRNVGRRWVVMVSPEDRTQLRGLVAFFYPCKYLAIFQTRYRQGKRSRHSFGRVILPVPAGLVADHINRNTLDNRRENLRAATVWQNSVNSKERASKSGLPRGVRRSGQRFTAVITFRRQQICLGTFGTAADASQAYRSARARLCGEFVPLHVPPTPTNDTQAKTLARAV